jgi:hypothetical protein
VAKTTDFRIAVVSAARLDDLEATQQRMLRQLAHIRRMLNATTTDQEITMATVAEIQAEVTEQTTVIDGAVTLLTSLAQQILDNVNDPVALEQIASDIQANTSELADAVTANTPVPPVEPTA